MSKREYILENFIGIQHNEQISLIDYLEKSVKECGTNRMVREFKNTFGRYQEKLELLLGFMKAYPTYNSAKRRLTRKKTFEELKDAAENHHISHCDESVIGQFAYSGEYYGETKRYFRSEAVTKEQIEDFKKEYEALSINKKREFIKDMIYAYQRINRLALPNQTPMLEAYKPIMLNILGEDLMAYYDKLYPTEQMDLIVRILDDYRWLKEDEEYYNLKLKKLSETPKVLRKLKQQAIMECRSSLE